MRERLFTATNDPPGSTRGLCPPGFISVARLTIDLNRLSRGQQEPATIKRGDFCHGVIRRLWLSVIVLLALATPAVVLFTLNYVSGELVQKALEVQTQFHDSIVP